MKQSEIKSLSEDELRERVEAESTNLAKLKFAHAVSPIENPVRIRHARRLVARLKTALRAKELTQQ